MMSENLCGCSCRFCGTDSARPVETTGLDGRPRYHMECEHCGARGRCGFLDELDAAENGAGVNGYGAQQWHEKLERESFNKKMGWDDETLTVEEVRR
jgi:hypothetical protein